MTRIVCISDTHGATVAVPDGDILIHAGDCTTDIGQRSLREFLKWFGCLPHQHKVLISGNHDGAFERWPDLARQMVNDVAPGVTYLQDSECVIEDLTIYGSPWTPTFMDWHFMADRGAPIREVWDRIPEFIDILVTHGPPFGFLDLSNNWDSAAGRKFDDHLGCRDLQEALYRTEPLLHVFGHIHGSGGKQTTYVGDTGHKTILVNAAIMDEAYIPNHKPVVITL